MTNNGGKLPIYELPPVMPQLLPSITTSTINENQITSEFKKKISLFDLHSSKVVNKVEIPQIIEPRIEMDERMQVKEENIENADIEKEGDEQDVLDVDDAFKKFSEMQEINRLRKEDDLLRNKGGKKKKAKEKYKRDIPSEKEIPSPYFNEVVISIKNSIRNSNIEIAEQIQQFDMFLSIFLDIFRKKVVIASPQQVVAYLNGAILYYLKHFDSFKVLSDIMSLMLIPDCLAKIVIKYNKRKKSDTNTEEEYINRNTSMLSIFMRCYLTNIEKSASQQESLLQNVYHIISVQGINTASLADFCLAFVKNGSYALKKTVTSECILKISEYKIGKHSSECIKSAICILSIISIQKVIPSSIVSVIEPLASLGYEFNPATLNELLDSTIISMMIGAPFPQHVKKIDDQISLQLQDTFLDVCYGISVLIGFKSDSNIEKIITTAIQQAKDDQQSWLTFLFVMYSMLPMKFSNKPKLLKSIGNILLPILVSCSDSFEKTLLISVSYYLAVDKQDLVALRDIYSKFTPDMKECMALKIHEVLSSKQE